MYDSVNQVALHPRLSAAVAQLLDVDAHDIRLTQAEVWPKYGRDAAAAAAAAAANPLDNDDQRMHCDFPNHTLTHPPPWDRPEAVEIILYLSDCGDCDGSTAVVPRQGADDAAYQYPMQHMPGFGTLQWKNDRYAAEAYLRQADADAARFRAQHLYPRERRVRYRFGTTLFYRHDTWHRGTPLRPGCLRLVVNMTLRKSAAEWVSTLHAGWAWAMYRADLQMERLIATASVQQRCLLGFPQPGHPYWNRSTLAAVGARYARLGMDMQPYVDACPLNES